MTNRKRDYAFAALPLLLFLTACGGGGGVTIPPPPPPPPLLDLPEGALVTYGSLPANGAFVIAEVNFTATTAQTMINGQSGALSALLPGHLVAMSGSTDASGRTAADELIFEANIVGPVDSVDANAGTLSIMGQPVTVVSDSILSTPLQNFSPGEVVQVSGYTDFDGVTTASRIDYSVPNNELRLVGTAESLDAANFHFMINDLVVDYSQAQLITTATGEVQEGMEVLITGGRSASGTFQVQTLTHYDRDLSDLTGSHVRAQGRITAAQSGSEFSVNGFPMVMGGQRDYRQGSSADIVPGAKVRVEGNVLDDATVQVHRVWFLQ